jgi:hypothetical protein
MSGTNRAEKLDHTIPIARAEVNRVGPEWLQTATTAEAYDSNIHLTDPRDVPDTIERMRQVGEPPLPERPRPPPAPTESELRERLSETLVVKQEADAAVATAMAARDRAQQLLVERQNALAGFGGLDQQITQHTVERLRENGRADLPDSLRERLAQRERARGDLAASEGALAVLSNELVDARNAAEAATRIATNVALAVLNTRIVQTVTRYQAALAEAEGSYRELAEYDRFIAARGVLPFSVASVMRAPPIDYRAMIASPGLDTSHWRTALAALMADPLAALETEA